MENPTKGDLGSWYLQTGPKLLCNVRIFYGMVSGLSRSKVCEPTYIRSIAL